MILLENVPSGAQILVVIKSASAAARLNLFTDYETGASRVSIRGTQANTSQRKIFHVV
jgi:hypothetical protein